MDTQTWASALKQVWGTLERWPIIVLLPISLVLPRLREPWGTSLTCLYIGFCLGQSAHYIASIWRHLSEYKKRTDRQKVMDEALKTYDYWHSEMMRLVTARGELYLAGKTAEAEALQPEIENAIKQKGKCLLIAAGIEKPDTK